MNEVKYLDKTGLTSVWSKVKGIVTPKADKVSGATAGHLAGLNSNGNLTDSGLPASNIAQKDGSYSGMTVGAAEDLVSAESVASEFTSRITGGSTAVGKGGTALLDKIKGRTLVWNQLNNFILYTDGTFNNVTRTLTGASNKVLTVTVGSGGPTAGNSITLVSGTLVFTPGHIYFFSVDTDFTMSTATLRYGPSNQDWFTENRKIWQWPSGSPAAGYFAVRYETTAAAGTYTLRNIMLIDLTKMFGAGSEPATPEEFEALYPGPFYDYNPGTLISNAATAIETVGFNIWDEEWETGNISSTTGQNATSTTLIRSKNSIKMIPGVAQYYLKAPTSVYFRWYDSNGNYIPFDTNYNDIPRRNEVFAPRTGAAYLRFLMTATAYDNDVSISVSNSERNGTYEPHWRSELELNIPTLTGKLNGTGNSVVIFPNGLRSAGTVFDEIVGNKAIKRIGAVDFGNMTWGSDTYREHTRFFSALADSKTNSSAYQLANQINSYGYISTPKVVADNTVNLGLSKYNNNIYIRNDAYEGQNGSVFAAAMSGVMLYYELATPEEYILDEAIPTAMRNDPYGTERRLPEDTAAIVTAPFRADITYSTNIKEAVQSLPQNYININSMQDFLAALGALMDGTWTMRPADGKFDFTFTPNPSNE